jgi:hypothetical protein
MRYFDSCILKVQINIEEASEAIYPDSQNSYRPLLPSDKPKLLPDLQNEFSRAYYKLLRSCAMRAEALLFCEMDIEI